jgi:hypothetical protein
VSTTARPTHRGDRQSFAAFAFDFEWQDSFAKARNLTLERARGGWILVIDPDEKLLMECHRANL